MGYWLTNNEKVKPRWRKLANILYNGFMILFLLRILGRLCVIDKQAFDEGIVNGVFTYGSCVFILAYFLLTIVYIIKPSLFLRKSLESNNKQEINTESKS